MATYPDVKSAPGRLPLERMGLAPPTAAHAGVAEKWSSAEWQLGTHHG